MHMLYNEGNKWIGNQDTGNCKSAKNGSVSWKWKLKLKGNKRRKESGRECNGKGEESHIDCLTRTCTSVLSVLAQILCLSSSAAGTCFQSQWLCNYLLFNQQFNKLSFLTKQTLRAINCVGESSSRSVIQWVCAGTVWERNWKQVQCQTIIINCYRMCVFLFRRIDRKKACCIASSNSALYGAQLRHMCKVVNWSGLLLIGYVG